MVHICASSKRSSARKLTDTGNDYMVIRIYMIMTTMRETVSWRPVFPFNSPLSSRARRHTLQMAESSEHSCSDLHMIFRCLFKLSQS